jgi:hypothetical protein
LVGHTKVGFFKKKLPDAVTQELTANGRRQGSLPQETSDNDFAYASAKSELCTSSAFKAANVRMGLAANNVKQYSCFRSKLI